MAEIVRAPTDPGVTVTEQVAAFGPKAVKAHVTLLKRSVPTEDWIVTVPTGTRSPAATSRTTTVVVLG
jgi:hypothetical protein